MTRVYVFGELFTITVPDGWTCWTCQGIAFRRVDGVIEQHFEGRWRKAACDRLTEEAA